MCMEALKQAGAVQIATKPLPLFECCTGRLRALTRLYPLSPVALFARRPDDQSFEKQLGRYSLWTEFHVIVILSLYECTKKIKSRLFIEYAAPGQAQPHQHKRCNHEPHNYEPHNHKPQNHEVYISVKSVGGNFYRGGLPGTPGEGSPAIFQFSGGCSTPIFGRFNGQTERIFGPGGLCPLANACLRL